MNKKFKSIIFDLDGTLIDSGPDLLEALNFVLEKNNLDPVVVIDCAHGNSNKDHNRQPIVFKDVISQRIQGNKNIVGLMIESNINPGNQTLGENLDDLEYGVSITDKCVGWEKTEEIILEASEELK